MLYVSSSVFSNRSYDANGLFDQVFTCTGLLFTVLVGTTVTGLRFVRAVLLLFCIEAEEKDKGLDSTRPRFPFSNHELRVKMLWCSHTSLLTFSHAVRFLSLYIQQSRSAIQLVRVTSLRRSY